MSTITVINGDDSGAGSLRAAIAAAHDGDTIVFGASAGNAQLTSKLTIAKDITIDATSHGPQGITIFGTAQVVIASGADVTLRRFAINAQDPSNGAQSPGTDGPDGDPGLPGQPGGPPTGPAVDGHPAIENHGTLTLDHCWVAGSSAGSFSAAGGDGGDGGVAGDGKTGGEGGAGGRGGDGGGAVGGVLNAGTLNIKDSVVTGHAVGKAGSDGGHGGMGGNAGAGGVGGNGGNGGFAGAGGDAVGGIHNLLGGVIHATGAVCLVDDEATAGHRGAGGVGGQPGFGGGTNGHVGITRGAGADGTATLHLLDEGSITGTVTTTGARFYSFVDETPANATVGLSQTSMSYTVEFMTSLLEDMADIGSVHWSVATGAGGPALSDFVGPTSGDLTLSGFAISHSEFLNLFLTLKADATAAKHESFTIQLSDPTNGNILGSVSSVVQNVVNTVSREADSVTGTSAAEAINAGAGADTINGGAGNDTLTGGAGDDSLIGGTGDDAFFVDSAGDRIVEAAGGGTDTVAASVSYTLTAGAAVETLRTTANGGTSAIDLTGDEFAQSITGNAGANALDGRGGADTMSGLGGNDVYFVDDAADRIVEGAGGGTDMVAARASYQLGAGVQIELLRTTSNAGTTAINLVGNEFGQAITGNAGANILIGRGGLDTLTGLGGADAFVFDRAIATANLDHVVDFAHGVDKIRIDHTIFAAVPVGALAASAFKDIGSSAEDSNDRVLYNHKNGYLYYDPDGPGGEGAHKFAVLDNHATLTATDILVIA